MGLQIHKVFFWMRLFSQAHSQTTSAIIRITYHLHHPAPFPIYPRSIPLLSSHCFASLVFLIHVIFVFALKFGVAPICGSFTQSKRRIILWNIVVLPDDSSWVARRYLVTDNALVDVKSSTHCTGAMGPFEDDTATQVLLGKTGF